LQTGSGAAVGSVGISVGGGSGPAVGSVGMAVGAAVGSAVVGVSVGAPVGVAVGGSDGASVGSAVGLVVGVAVGMDVGAKVGAALGAALGLSLGAEVGVDVGFSVGTVVGARVGSSVVGGSVVGGSVGTLVGAAVGGSVGVVVGTEVGTAVGRPVGRLVGACVGASVGRWVGWWVGVRVGTAVGFLVGVGVALTAWQNVFEIVPSAWPSAENELISIGGTVVQPATSRERIPPPISNIITVYPARLSSANLAVVCALSDGWPSVSISTIFFTLPRPPLSIFCASMSARAMYVPWRYGRLERCGRREFLSETSPVSLLADEENITMPACTAAGVMPRLETSARANVICWPQCVSLTEPDESITIETSTLPHGFIGTTGAYVGAAWGPVLM
jgi:hypothetical protein